MKQQHAKGHTAKHTSTKKHSGSKKHNPGKQHQGHGKKGPKTSPGPLVVAQHPKHQKARKLAGGVLPDWDACTAIALGASLRVAGWPVGDEDVLALHVAAGGSRDTGVSILAALETAARVGLAGAKPRWVPVTQPLCACVFIGTGEPGLCAHQAIGGAAEEARNVFAGEDASHASVTGPVRAQFGAASTHGLIVGAELPGPHALALDGPGVWSWGEWHPWSCFPGAVVEEAWAVIWP